MSKHYSYLFEQETPRRNTERQHKESARLSQSFLPPQPYFSGREPFELKRGVSYITKLNENSSAKLYQTRVHRKVNQTYIDPGPFEERSSLSRLRNSTHRERRVLNRTSPELNKKFFIDLRNTSNIFIEESGVKYGAKTLGNIRNDRIHDQAQPISVRLSSKMEDSRISDGSLSNSNRSK